MDPRIRTDLALEVRESFPEDDVEIKGVILTEESDEENNIKVSIVEIKDEKGAKAMQRPIGTYITIEAPELTESDEDYHKPVTKVIIEHLMKLLGNHKNEEVLIVGLGNREVTADALGPKVVDNLFITRHLFREMGEEFAKRNSLGNVSAIAPGVMAQTGMEVAEIVKGIVEQTHPKVIIVIDALAARNVSRLNSTIQITDTGISPGSGVGNHRKALNEETLGVKVIAIGVPTVVDASTIVSDTLRKYMVEHDYDEEDTFSFISEVNGTDMDLLHVTPKNIDEAIKKMSFTISEALNSCFAQSL